MEINVRKRIMPIKGMHCKSCKSKIEYELGALEGVKKINVDLLEETAEIEFDPEKVSITDIKNTVLDLGYSIDVDGAPKKNWFQGLLYGLLPHTGCIAFIFGSVFGVTFLMQFFKPLLMNRYFFHFLMLLSLGFATVSSALYLRRIGFLSIAGMKRKCKYLTTMFGSTIGINLLLFMVIFPILANVSATPAAAAGFTGDLSALRLAVDIPCPGHAPLISEELKTVNGVAGVQFGFPNNFDVSYDPLTTSEGEILSLEVFQTYEATVQSSTTPTQSTLTTSGTCGSESGGCSCGGGFT